MTSSQERARPSRGNEYEHEPATDATAGGDTARKARLDADVDDLLDEIDDVLEENAEEFVTSFIQKGGE